MSKTHTVARHRATLSDCNAQNHKLGCQCGFGIRGAEERSNRAFVVRRQEQAAQVRADWAARGIVNPNRA